MGDYIEKADLEKRLSARVVAEILDDDSDGTADTDAVDQLIADAESWMAARVQQHYPLSSVQAADLSEVKRLCLDVAVCYAYERHPEYVRSAPPWERVRSDFSDLRKGWAGLGTDSAPEPGTQHGVLGFDQNNQDGLDDAGQPCDPVWSDFGDF